VVSGLLLQKINGWQRIKLPIYLVMVNFSIIVALKGVNMVAVHVEITNFSDTANF
jgi:hypothetical protein